MTSNSGNSDFGTHNVNELRLNEDDIPNHPIEPAERVTLSIRVLAPHFATAPVTISDSSQTRLGMIIFIALFDCGGSTIEVQAAQVITYASA